MDAIKLKKQIIFTEENGTKQFRDLGSESKIEGMIQRQRQNLSINLTTDLKKREKSLGSCSAEFFSKKQQIKVTRKGSSSFLLIALILWMYS